ncbi:MAG: hypothetical protein R6V12_12615 [Candidatus Hydrogenedentota bacterium]
MHNKKQKTKCGADVMDAIRNAYPQSIVRDDVVYDEDSYYHEIRDDVRTALSRIKQTDLTYHRPPEGKSHWKNGVDPDKEPPSCLEEPASYDLLFLALRGRQFEFEGELDEEHLPEGAEEPITVIVPSVGRIGCAVGISIVAPFAVIRFTEMEWTESGSETMPDIWPRMFNLDGSKLDVEAHYGELFLEEGLIALRGLRETVTKTLGKFGIRTLSEQELECPIPGLKPEPTPNAVLQNENVTVKNALFFQTI